MRRKEREITDEQKIDEIISSCHCCRLGFYDNGKVYIVPLNFGYCRENNTRIIYFHSAKSGRKIDLIRQNGAAGFELDTNYRLKEGTTACSYTAAYQSVIGTGTVTFVEDTMEKIAALQRIMSHNTGKDIWEFNASMVDAVTVLKLRVEEISCKEHL